MTAIAVIGLGAMGRRLAARLLDQGHTVSIWNRTPTPHATTLRERGARLAHTPAQAVQGSEAAIVMVSDSTALRAVTEGPDGILTTGKLPALLQMSTVAPSDTARLAAALPASTELLDTPVLGSIAEAESGTLQLLVGATQKAYATWQEVLRSLGTPRLLGPPGAGTAAKLVANSALFGMIGVLGESLKLAQALGLPTETTFDILDTTPLAAQAERRKAAITNRAYPPRFTLTLARKDADLITEAARSAGIELRLAESMHTWLTDAEEAGWATHDYTAVLGHLLTHKPNSM
jgi:3-hydroxyisobutyrate dehydrogenase